MWNNDEKNKKGRRLTGEGKRDWAFNDGSRGKKNIYVKKNNSIVNKILEGWEFKLLKLGYCNSLCLGLNKEE